MKFSKKNTHKLQVLLEMVGNSVYYGPFTGLKIPDSLIPHLTIPEVLGLYESCLFNVWSKLLSKNIKNILVVGGHYGYYSAGLSYFYQPDQVYIFETDITCHHLILDWIEPNNLNNFHIYESATEQIFKGWENEVDLIICDCEGEEMILLDPIQFPWQQQTKIVIELHPFYRENLTGTISKKFSKTHHLELIYDDFEEDKKIQQVLSGLDLDNLNYIKHPKHRWIIKEGKKIYTSGIFMFLEPKL
ncbi:hypothetical protein [Pedobacter rhodius]|uniref:Methyltransferase FkbM domain-containing protein n=1 Tax=Pedobacter rhodius TaxID=3004098 RepID=A0ABT4KSB3_9SPHI|nr:hypothetical protein [Pedobacter sp. SJ11]MCZ4221810.1 hypothetical protein [Pedobacter sp. SJ11]